MFIKEFINSGCREYNVSIADGKVVLTSVLDENYKEPYRFNSLTESIETVSKLINNSI